VGSRRRTLAPHQNHPNVHSPKLFPDACAKALAALGILALLACTDTSAPSLPPAPNVTSVLVDTTDVGRIALAITLDQPGALQVEYWDDPSHRLRLDLQNGSASGTILLTSLRAGHDYQFEVTGLSASGVQGLPLTGTLRAPALPADLAQLSFTTSGTPTDPIAMLEVNAAFKGFVAVDGSGQIVWWFRTKGAPQGFTRRANGNFVFNDLANRLVEVTPAGEEVHELRPLSNGDRTAHHDVVATPQNTLLFLAQEPGTFAGASLVGDAIWEWNPETGAVDRRWSAFDFLDPAVDVGGHSLAYDWVHANSLAMGDHGNVILSLNWLDQIVSIAPSWKTFEWRLGGHGSTFALDTNAVFQGQHTAAVLANGHVLMFDNGRDRGGPAQFTRGLELSLDTTKKTASVAWQFRPSLPIFAPYIGAARRLPNGNTLVFFGLSTGQLGGTGPIAGYEARPDGSVAWQITVRNATTVYRATPLASIGGEVAVP
jgi:hypothetical protein